MRKAAPSLMMTLAIAAIANSTAHAEIAWQSNLRAAHAQAQSEGKLLLLHFYADNCKWCDQLEVGAFQQVEVGKAISERYVPVKVHANSSPKLAEMFNVTKFPTDVIVTTGGTTLSHSVSPQEPDRYVAMLRTSAQQSDVASTPAPAAVVAAAPSMEPQSMEPQSMEPQSMEPQSQVGPSAAGASLQPPTTASGDTSNPSVALPGYAAYASPQTPGGSSIGLPSASSPSTTSGSVSGGGFTLPDTALGGGTPARAAGTAGLSFELPGLDESLAQYPHVESPPSPETSPSSSVTDTPENATGSASSAAPHAVKQPDLAMQGFCPVTVIRDDKWVEGKPEFGVIHLGKLYLFSSKENMQSFLNDPVPYTPVLNEIDAVVFFEERRIIPGKREWGLKDPIYNRMFFFADEASMKHFYNQYERYTRAAIEVMDKAVKDANPGT